MVDVAKEDDKDTFFGTSYRIGNTKIVYEKEKLDRLHLEICRVLKEHKFSTDGVDLDEVCQHVIGFANSPERAIILNGPKFCPRSEFPADYDWHENWMSEDRKMIDDLLNVVFSRIDLVARNSKSIVLTPFLYSVEFGPNAFRSAVILYAPSSSIIGPDHMRVVIEGKGDGPNTFKFQHTKMWMRRRYID
jgi:hypothetical protein